MLIDEKTPRGSSDSRHGGGSLHLLNAGAFEKWLNLAEVHAAKPSKKIAAITLLLRQITTKKAMITVDAMGTQVKTAKLLTP